MVTAAVAQFRTLGVTVSAPHLNPSKKARSSRRYVPFSPELPSDEVVADPAPNGPTGDMPVDLETGFDEGDELAVRRAIDRSQQGIWSGRHHKAVGLEHSEDEEDENDGEIDDAQEDSEDDEYDDWDVEEGLENLFQADGLSALDRIGEDFERNVARNSGFSYFEFNTM